MRNAFLLVFVILCFSFSFYGCTTSVTQDQISDSTTTSTSLGNTTTTTTGGTSTTTTTTTTSTTLASNSTTTTATTTTISTTTTITTTTTTTTSTTTTTVIPSTPVLIKPLDDAITLSAMPTFDWGDATGASKYEIQIDNNSDFSSLTQISTPTASTYTATTLNSGTYYWRVKAGNTWGDWSITRRLVIGSVLAKMNGDDYSDVLVGADLVDVISTPGADRGQAYFYFGGSPMNTVSDVTVSGGSNLGYLGYTVASAGDVNNDGYADALIGAWQASAGGSLRGQAYLFYGANALSGSKATSEADVIFSGGANEDYFSRSIASAGDVNNDGYMDIIVGAYAAEGGGTNRGQAYIYFGGSPMDNTADVTFSGTENEGYLGWSVASAGDVNNDGYADIIVGAYAVDVSGTDRGQAYIYFGGANMDSTADITISGVTSTDQLGWSVASAGDVNGDGYGDVIIGAHRENGGQAYVYFGGSSFSGSKTSADANLTMSGGSGTDFFGDAVASAGDVNNDGYSDVIVGAYLADAGGTDRGQAYIYLGGASMDNTADITFNGGTNYDYLGYAVSSAGDVNNDGYSDVIVGAYLADAGGTDRGQTYIYLGGASMDSTADITFSGSANSDYLGRSVGGGQ